MSFRFHSIIYPLQILLLFLVAVSCLCGCDALTSSPPSTLPTPVFTPTTFTLLETPEGNDSVDTYLSQYCPFSFIVPNGWEVREIGAGEPGSHSLIAPTINLTKEEYQLAIICYVMASESEINPGGRGAGDIIEMEAIPFIDSFAHGQVAIWEGSRVSVLYSYESDHLTVFADLGHNPDPKNPVPYQEFTISDTCIAEVVQLLESVSLTEDLTNLSPTPTSEDPLAILPMEDYYHSQLEDITLPNACAPTAGYIVLDYLKRETTLEELARLFRNVDPEHGGYDPSCQRNVVCTSPMTLAQRMSSEYHLTIHTRQGWTLEQAFHALELGHPIIADILWRLDGRSLGHFVVIFGVDREERLIYYHDPLEGENQIAPWEIFSQRWVGPVDVGDPTFLDGFQFWGMEVYSEDWENKGNP